MRYTKHQVLDSDLVSSTYYACIFHIRISFYKIKDFGSSHGKPLLPKWPYLAEFSNIGFFNPRSLQVELKIKRLFNLKYINKQQIGVI